MDLCHVFIIVSCIVLVGGFGWVIDYFMRVILGKDPDERD